ncbi:MAG: transposase [Nitrospirota bacterium]
MSQGYQYILTRQHLDVFFCEWLLYHLTECRQELARIGYNPVKRGRSSYHSLLCFNGITKDFWHRELRAGDTHASTGIIDLLEASFAKLPISVKTVIIRADKGFYDHKTIKYLESKHVLFAIIAKITRPVKRKLTSLSYRKYTSLFTQ